MDRNPVYTSNTSKFIAEENGKSFFFMKFELVPHHAMLETLKVRLTADHSGA